MKQLPKPRIALVHRPESDRVLVIRRGPSKYVAFFGWDRRDNSITIGQWLKGHVFPLRSDLSPNGRHIIYFTSNYQKIHSESQGAWTAVSRFPYMKALDFWPKGDSWNGGGLFYSNRKYLLNELGEHHTRHTISNRFDIQRGVPESPVRNNECLGIYIPKLLRDHWVLRDEGKDSIGKVYTFTKKMNNHLVLNKTLHATSSPPIGKGCYFEEHFIEGVSAGRSDFSGVEYLDYYKGTIFWPEEGKLFTSKVIKSVIDEPVMIHDFSEYKYQRIKAPY